MRLLLLLLLLRLLECVSLGFSALVVGYVVDCEVEFCCGAGEHGFGLWRINGGWEGGMDWIGGWMDGGGGMGRIWENSRYVEYLGM